MLYSLASTTTILAFTTRIVVTFDTWKRNFVIIWCLLERLASIIFLWFYRLWGLVDLIHSLLFVVHFQLHLHLMMHVSKVLALVCVTYKYSFYFVLFKIVCRRRATLAHLDRNQVWMWLVLWITWSSISVILNFTDQILHITELRFWRHQVRFFITHASTSFAFLYNWSMWWSYLLLMSIHFKDHIELLGWPTNLKQLFVDSIVNIIEISFVYWFFVFVDYFDWVVDHFVL